jgi:pyruvate formate lyase activating enzyme
VTLSGGECTLFPTFVESLLKMLKENGIHTAIQTCGYFDYEIFKARILPYVDLIFYDVKIADPGLHRKYLGKSNRRIVENLGKLLRETGVEVRPRVPLVPGITATAKNLELVVDLLSKAGAGDVTLLPYNPLGLEMNVNLGRSKPPLPERFMSREEEEDLRRLFIDILQARAGLGVKLPREGK